MTRFALLVRGINVGGKNKVLMAELREELQTIGLDGVETYINSGNIFFESASSKAELVDLLGHFFRDHYPFIQSFSLFSAGSLIMSQNCHTLTSFSTFSLSQLYLIA